MIIQFLIGVVSDVATAIIGLLPVWDPPEFLQEIGTMATQAGALLSGLGPWVNWVVLNGCILGVTASWVLFAKLKLLRTGGSYIPVFGGGK